MNMKTTAGLSINHREAVTQSEQAIRASELSYRRLFEAARDGILILDIDTGRISDVNPFLVELLGFSHSEMVGKTVGELSPFKDIVSNQAMLERLQKDGHVRYEDLPLQTRDGRKIVVEFVSNVYQAGDRNVIQCNIRDITERKRAEEALRQQAEELTRFNRVAAGRELRVIELKQQVNDLAAQLGQARPYPLAFMDAAAAQIVRSTPMPIETHRFRNNRKPWTKSNSHNEK